MDIKNLTISYSDKKVFDCFNLSFEKGKVTAILGSSGVGKTTLLRAISSLVDYDGQIIGAGKISYMFQEARLIPTLTVKDNLLYALNDEQKFSKLEDLNKLIQMVGLCGEEDSFPDELSGGMESRVSLIRAFLVDSDTLLMDEPLRSLDLVTKQKILFDMKTILAEYPRTVILVSHDPRECVYLADRIIVLSGSPACVVLDENAVKNMTESEIVAFENKLVSCIGD